ncbi:hypothetical protein GGD68_005668 [Paraburkholderia fungorum]|uniref:Uncharacterized protein n=1 Tax=Paraburkholderia fungorum TaxID=134537 RepID=A0AAW3VAW0_9BURK|nr:hypothetical protein [Paraburkholderia fungorum]MBB5542897.1 hypothetical protein [Paraburkholderia fungorum]MBB6207060.1 hypothetical protein [Paraburkholderia fungorum]
MSTSTAIVQATAAIVVERPVVMLAGSPKPVVA